MADAMTIALGKPERRFAMTERAAAMVAGGGGVEAAARLVIEVNARRRASA